MKNKSLKTIFWVQILVFILVNNFSFSFAAENVHTLQSGSPSFVSDIANIVMAVAAVANIWAIIWYYLKDKNIRSEEQQTNNRLYWYRDVIVDKNINALEKFFGQSLEIIDQYKQLVMEKEELSESEFLGHAREIFGEYNTEKYLVGRSFIEVITVVNKNLGQDLYKLFDQFQDDFTVSLANLTIATNMNGFTKLKNLVYDEKRTVLEKIYSFGQANRG